MYLKSIVTTLCVILISAFSLQPTYRFALINDANVTGKTKFGWRNSLHLRETLEDINRQSLDFVIINGDLVHKAEKAVEQAEFEKIYIEYTQTGKIPLYINVGNHDMVMTFSNGIVNGNSVYGAWWPEGGPFTWIENLTGSPQPWQMDFKNSHFHAMFEHNDIRIENSEVLPPEYFNWGTVLENDLTLQDQQLNPDYVFILSHAPYEGNNNPHAWEVSSERSVITNFKPVIKLSGDPKNLYEVNGEFVEALPYDYYTKEAAIHKNILELWGMETRLEPQYAMISVFPDNRILMEYRQVKRNRFNYSKEFRINRTTESISVSETPANKTPDVYAGPSKTITLTDPEYTMDARVNDDSSGLSYTWTMIQGPASVAMNNNILNPTVTFSATGEYVFRLTASDGDLSFCDDVRINVLNSGMEIGSGFQAKYYPNTTMSGTPIQKVDPTIDFYWANEISPDPAIPAGAYSAEWEGYLFVDEPGEYYFYLTVNESGSVWLDDELVVNSIGNTSGNAVAEKVILEAGPAYSIKVSMTNVSGTGIARLYWSRESDKFQEPIPVGNIYPELPTHTVPTPELVTHLNFDEGSGNIAGDSTANNADGVVTGTWVKSLKGNALNFDGIDDGVVLPTREKLDVVNAISLSAWVKLDSVNGHSRIVSKQFEVNGDTGNSSFQLGINANNKWRFSVGGVFDVTPVAPEPEIGKWYHVVATYDRVNTTIYVDGEVIYFSSAFSAPIRSNPNEPVTVGFSQYQALKDYHFPGTIDEVRIYNYKISTSDVQALYQDGKQYLVGYWKLDETTGNTATDSTVFENHSSLINGPTWEESIHGNGLYFDGTDDFVQVADAADGSLDQGTDDFTVMFWVKRDAPGENHEGIYSTAPHFGKDNSYHIMIHSDNQIKMQFGDGDSKPWFDIPNTEIADTQWHHVALVFDRDTEVRAYIDGQLRGNNTIIGTIQGTLNNDFDKYIGKSGDKYLKGNLDDLRIYNHALTSQEILTAIE